MKSLHVLSGGAAQALVNQVSESFLAQSGCAIHGTFSAVGVMRDKLVAGEACDVVILSQSLIDQLTVSGHVVSGSARSLGDVKTGIAIKAGEAQPPVSSPAELKAALLAASYVYFPDPVKATAGIHFFNVLKQLGIDTELAPRLRTYPNGATAMQALAQASEVGAIGCTQVTEINFTPGVVLIDVLPKEFELATRYVAAVSSQAKEPAAADQLISLLSSPENAGLRQSLGFE